MSKRSVPGLSSAFKRPKVQESNGQGKIRVKEHQIGNWPTHIQIPIECGQYERIQEQISEFMKDHCHSVFTDPLHHSLSRTVYPKTHQVDRLMELLEHKLGHLRKLVIHYKRELEVYSNDQKTRFFLCINCEKASNDTLSSWTTTVDSCLFQFGLETFYKKPRFHLSLACCSSDVFTKHLDELTALLPEELLCVNGEAIQIRSGNKESKIKLG